MKHYPQVTKLVTALVFVTLTLAGMSFFTSIQAAQAINPNAALTAHPHKPLELLVKFKPGISALQGVSIAQNMGAVKTKSLGRSAKFATESVAQWQHVTLTPGMDLLATKASLEQDPAVEFVELNYEYFTNQIPNDPFFAQTWGLHNTGQTAGTADADIDAPETWNAGTGNYDTLVAVIDTGVDYNHPDLAANIWTNPGEIAGNGIDDDGNGYIDDIHGYDFRNNDGDPMDDNRHGTHVSGTIAAIGNNGIGVAGINWQTRVMAVKVFPASGGGFLSDIIPGILYATANGAKVLNNSWGGGPFSQALLDAINTSNNAGALFVAAAGNSSNNNDIRPFYPATYTVPNIISVAATDHNDARAYFSSYGARTVDLAAPGVSIYSTLPNAGYGLLSGTSMATPHVSGAATLLMAISPQYTHLQVKEVILNSVDLIPAMAGITVTGGRLNISRVVSPDIIAPDPVTDLAVTTVGTLSVALSWTATGDDGSVGQAVSYDLRYSTAPIDEANFAAANSVGLLAVSGPVGTPEQFTVNGLSSNVTYYFALKVIDDVSNASLISNLVSGTTQNSNVYFNDSMENGIAKWIIEGTDGRSGPALWHISTNRAISPVSAMYYGHTYGRYYSGGWSVGSITTVPIDLRGVFDPHLSFSHYLDINDLDATEIILIQVTTDGGLSWNDLFDTNKGTNKTWQQMDFKLNDFEDQVIQIRFSFDSGAVIRSSAYEGWYLDNVRVYTLAGPNQPPVANPGGPYTGLAGQVVTLTGALSSDPDGDALTYAWDFGDGTIGTGVSPVHSYALAGSYQVSLVVNDGVLDSLPVSTTVTITVAGGNLPPTANAGGPYSAAVNQAITFSGSLSSDPDGDVLTYAWDFGDGSIGTGVTPVHAYTTAGTYQVTLVVNDGTVNSTATTTNATITTGGGTNLPPVADVGGPYQGHWALALEMTADASYDPDGDVLTYAWNFGDGTTGTGNAPQHAYSKPGTYTVTMTASDGQASASASTTATITNNAPVANAGGPYTGVAGAGIELNGDGSSDPDDDTLSYQWDFGDGSTGTSVGPVHNYSSPGTYTITLTVTDGVDSNSDSTTATVQ